MRFNKKSFGKWVIAELTGTTPFLEFHFNGTRLSVKSSVYEFGPKIETPDAEGNVQDNVPVDPADISGGKL